MRETNSHLTISSLSNNKVVLVHPGYAAVIIIIIINFLSIFGDFLRERQRERHTHTQIRNLKCLYRYLYR